MGGYITAQQYFNSILKWKKVKLFFFRLNIHFIATAIRLWDFLTFNHTPEESIAPHSQKKTITLIWFNDWCSHRIWKDKTYEEYSTSFIFPTFRALENLKVNLKRHRKEKVKWPRNQRNFRRYEQLVQSSKRMWLFTKLIQVNNSAEILNEGKLA